MDHSGTDAALTLPGTLRRTATVGSLTNPDAGVVTPDERAPWGRVLTGAESLAARLAGLGVPDRARIGLVADGSVTAVEMLFACGLLGAVGVPLDTGYDPSHLRRVLAAADVDTVVTTGGPGLAALVRAAVPDLGRTDLPEGLPALRRAFSIRTGEPGFVTVSDDPGLPAPDRWVTPDDVALIVHTAGLQGRPLTHGALVAAARALGRDRLGCGPDDVLWDALPPHHVGFVTPLLAILDAGGTVVTDRRFDADRALRQIRDERVSVAFTCFPAVTDALLAHPGFDAAFARTRIMLHAAPPETARAVQSRAPRAVVLTSYGSGGTGGIAATTHPDDPDDARLGTAGRPLPGIGMAVVDPDTGGPLPSGEPGELLVRGPGGDPYDRDGWLRSGDLGLIDGDGRVHYRGRVADMLSVGGENVAAIEVESVLAAHPAVRTAAVVAAPDPRWTQVPAAFVELRPGAAATAAELQEHCASSLARFKVPRHIRFVTEWPMSTTRIRKGPLRERIARELGET